MPDKGRPITPSMTQPSRGDKPGTATPGKSVPGNSGEPSGAQPHGK